MVICGVYGGGIAGGDGETCIKANGGVMKLMALNLLLENNATLTKFSVQFVCLRILLPL
jgi:hypothetical protein